MRAHTITTKTLVGGRGHARRTIGPGVLTLSLAVVLLAASASTASAEKTLGTWNCPPPTSPATDIGQVSLGCFGGPLFGNSSFNFGDRQVETTSPVQRFALAVWCRPGHGVCPDTLNPSIAVPGDYAQTNNCPPTLSASYPGQLQGCIIEVTFAPTSTGPKGSTLSTGPGSPTVRLTGNGVTTATPPALPLLLSAWYRGAPSADRWAVLQKKLTLFATTNNDSTVVVRGGVKKTVAHTMGGEPPTATTIKAEFKHLRQLKESPTEPTVRIKVAATDEFGQKATEELKIKLCRRTVSHGEAYCGRWSGGRGDARRRRSVAVGKDTANVKTSVQLEWTAGPDPSDPEAGASFSGRVKAKHDCRKARKVVLYSPYGIAGFDKSNARGKFEIVEQHGGAGRERHARRRGTLQFYAVAEERKITKQNGDKIVCKAGSSERVKATVRAPN